MTNKTRNWVLFHVTPPGMRRPSGQNFFIGLKTAKARLLSLDCGLNRNKGLLLLVMATRIKLLEQSFGGINGSLYTLLFGYFTF